MVPAMVTAPKPQQAPTPAGVLFDMDGVLVESTEAWFRVVEEAGRRFRGRAITREEFDPTFGQGADADVQVFGLDITPEALDRFYFEEFPAHARETMWVNPEAAPLLETLRARGLRLSVVTNTMAKLARIILDTARLWDHFDAVVCADEVPRAKPAPDPILEGCRRLSLSTGEVWMIGDSRFDAESAASAGVWFVGMKRAGDARIEALSRLATLVPDRVRSP
jgi:phosphoglycolate phosphatase/AHBA synthesis associated protein